MNNASDLALVFVVLLGLPSLLSVSLIAWCRRCERGAWVKTAEPADQSPDARQFDDFAVWIDLWN
jgi:hypothetical protein